MRLFRGQVHGKWSTTQTILASLFLATICFVILSLLRERGVLPAAKPPSSGSSGGIGEYADLVSLATIGISLLMPILTGLSWRFLAWLRPKPGTRPLDETDVESLKKGFKVDRGNITLATVPSHRFQAEAATSTRNIDLGDAVLVIPESDQKALKDFIQKPRTRQKKGESPYQQVEDDILIITGEPGAGKSVLMQEVHATLSLGVEAGHHSFVPLFVFARDLTLANVERASQATDAPIRSLLFEYYEKKRAEPANEDLMILATLVKYQWEERDFLIIIDGLDEIAQRSAYEEIQRKLAGIILRDLKSDLLRVHRYILSCRVDEDLELFHSARSLFLRGLTGDEREKFCRALIGASSLDRETKASLEEALQSPRLTPTHVFRRNPYFLSLLIRHIREDQDRVRDRTIDFDLLMRTYLERESNRAYALVDGKDRKNTDNRRELFRELEGVSRACLQYIAFRSASSAKTGALYDETPIDGSLVLGFVDNLRSAREPSEGDLWNTLRRFIDFCLAPDRATSIAAESIHKQGFAEHLHENDIRLLYSLAGSLVANPSLEMHTLKEAIGTIAFRGGLESPEWYDNIVTNYRSIVEQARLKPDPRQALAALLFLRSIAAAHVLRILNVNVPRGLIQIRFRHRRLAEYYAACYMRDRWAALQGSLDFSPWLSPVLNLTCALEGVQCHALSWMVERISAVPAEPYFEWRYSAEAAVEASFFAQPGPAYKAAIKTLVSKVVDAFAIRGPRPRGAELDAVTRMVLFRALEQIGQLETTSQFEDILDDRTRELFYQYESSVSAEWIAPLLPARLAIQRLSGKTHPLSSRLRVMWKMIKLPSAVLFPRFRMSWAGLLLTRITVILSTILSEICGLAIFVAVLSGLIYALATISGAERSTVWDAVRLVALILFISYIALRLLAWQQSPTRAASQAAILWRAPAILADEIRSGIFGSRGTRGEGVRRGMLLLQLAGSLVLAAGITLGLAYLWPASRTESALKPCPEIDKQEDNIAKKFTTKIGTIGLAGEVGLADLQRELRKDLQSFREANKRKCGSKADEGWVLAEDGLADWFAKYDPRLVPSPSKDESLALSTKEARALKAFLSVPIPKMPEEDFFGSLATVYRSRQIDRIVKELKALRSRIVAARREGIGIPANASHVLAMTVDEKPLRKPSQDIATSNAYDEKLVEILEKYKPIQTVFTKKSKRTLVYGAVGFVALGMLLLLARAYWRQRRDRKQLALLAQERSVARLCSVLLESSRSERVRLGAIRRLDLLGVNDSNSLKLVEQAAGQLLKRSSETEHNLGINVAALVRTLSNRLRHRITTDAPVKGVVSA
jgi:NACHT domain-containing protein